MHKKSAASEGSPIGTLTLDPWAGLPSPRPLYFMPPNLNPEYAPDPALLLLCI